MSDASRAGAKMVNASRGRYGQRFARGAGVRLLVLGLLVFAARYPLSGCIESRTFYWPSRAPFETPTGVEDVSFDGPEGRTLHGWFIRAVGAAPGERRPAVLHVHGNAGSVDAHIDFCGWLAEHGYHVMLFDYRGFGRSDPGRPHRRALRADTIAAWETLTRRADVDGQRCAVFGFSMGAVIGLSAMDEMTEARAMVAAAGFSSWPGVAHDHLPILGPLLIRRGLDAEDTAALLGDRPLLIVHGDRDRIVNIRHAGRIEAGAQRAGVDVEVLTVPGADHEDLLVSYPEVRAAIVAFLDRSMPEGATDDSPIAPASESDNEPEG